MQPYQREFLQLALACKALQFGDFTLKSGRHSPYFFNAGRFDSGAALMAVGNAYAQAALDSKIRFDALFGPAYKGIPLATTTAIALAQRYNRNVPIVFNRKEAKDHGEGGLLMGAPLVGRVLIVDDVITAGTATRQALELIHRHGATPTGILIALDREERGTHTCSASQEITTQWGIPVVAIARLTELLALTQERAELAGYQDKLAAYRAEYGT